MRERKIKNFERERHSLRVRNRKKRSEREIKKKEGERDKI